MARLNAIERNTKLRQLRRGQVSPGLSPSSSPQRQCCSVLNVVACSCIFLNVLLWSIQIMANARDGVEGVHFFQTKKLTSTTGADKFKVTPAIPKENPTPIHIVFQTDCRDLVQDWQAYVLFHSIYKLNQPGEVTRVVTGCNHDARLDTILSNHKLQVEPMGRAEPNSPSRFHIHIAPAHPNQHGVNALRTTMRYFNRPFGVYHWFEHVLGYSKSKPSNFHDDTVIIMLDTDMFIMRPFGTEFDSNTEIWGELLNPQQPPQKVLPGQLLAQHLDFPSRWWTHHIDAKKATRDIAPALAKLQQMPLATLQSHYAAGPPFLAVAKDFYPVVQKWAEFTFPLYQAMTDKVTREPHSAYALAIAHLNMPHQLAETFAVINHRDRAFDLFKASFGGREISTEMGKPEAQCRNVPISVKPHVLQYSKRYALGDFIIGKHYVPMAFLGTDESCTNPMFAEPPDNIAQHTKSYMDPEKKEVVEINEPIVVLQMSIMVCEIIQALNEAGAYFRNNSCKHLNGINFEKTITFPGGQLPET
jgi:hypothetical protein